MDADEAALSLDSGDLALDFLNTRRMRRGEPFDQLADAPGLTAWLDAAGLGSPLALELLASPPAARLLLEEAHRLRGVVLETVHAWSSGQAVPTPALHALNRVLAASRIGLRAEPRDGGVQLVRVETGRDVLTVLAPIAAAAVALVAEASADRVRQCASGECVVWFLDTSKNGRRKWCSMARCGNRAKVARHYRKQRGAAGD